MPLEIRAVQETIHENNAAVMAVKSLVHPLARDRGPIRRKPVQRPAAIVAASRIKAAVVVDGRVGVDAVWAVLVIGVTDPPEDFAVVGVYTMMDCLSMVTITRRFGSRTTMGEQ